MLDQSVAIAAAVRALRGESALDAVRPALADEILARVIACAPKDIAAPALHDALARLIGTETRSRSIGMRWSRSWDFRIATRTCMPR